MNDNTSHAAVTTRRITRTLVTRRQQRRLTQQDLADIHDVTRQAVSLWENSAGELNFTTVARWAATLGYTLELTTIAPVTELKCDTGENVNLNITTHAIITGPAATRAAIIDIIINEHPARHLHHIGADTNDTTVDELVGAVHEHAACTPANCHHRTLNGGSIIVYTLNPNDREEHDTTLHALISAARAAGAAILVEGGEHPPTNGVLTQNIGLHIHANTAASITATGATDHADNTPRTQHWYLTQHTPHQA